MMDPASMNTDTDDMITKKESIPTEAHLMKRKNVVVDMI
jgi:hypothetical protein